MQKILALLVLASVSCKFKVSEVATSPADSSLPTLTFTIDGDYHAVQGVVVKFSPAQFKISSKNKLNDVKGTIELEMKDEVCKNQEPFLFQTKQIRKGEAEKNEKKLRAETHVSSLICEAPEIYRDVEDTFAENLYFFPRGSHCQLGRLVSDDAVHYEVEYCGVAVSSEEHNDCVVCEPDCKDDIAKTKIEKNKSFVLSDAKYPFDLLSSSASDTYAVEVKDIGSNWREQDVIFAGNGVFALGRSCLFASGCQVRIERTNDKCVSP